MVAVASFASEIFFLGLPSTFAAIPPGASLLGQQWVNAQVTAVNRAVAIAVATVAKVMDVEQDGQEG